MHNHDECPHASDLPAFLQGELSQDARASLEQHLKNCPACRAAAESHRRTIEMLGRPLPPVESQDLAPAILERVQAGNRSLRPVFLRAAALVLGLVGVGALVGLVVPRLGTRADPRVTAAAVWLRTTQEPDGHWDTFKWGAQKNYAPGIAALAVLALLKQDENALDGPNGDAIRRGLDYLLGQQNPEGRIGALNSGTPYNQGLATLAFLEACARANDTRWKQAATLALTYIRTNQQPSGGWGYPREATDSCNTSITVWQLQALIKADSMGQYGMQPSIEKGLAWLDSAVDEKGRVGYAHANDFPYGYETLTAAGAVCFLNNKYRRTSSARLPRILEALRDAARQTSDVDYYRLYFMTQALSASGGSDTELAAKLRDSLRLCQAGTGEHVGSFETQDRWSSAGGRVYATAMAVLAL